MTVINKYPFQTKKGNKEFFKRKDQELTNLDWAKWAGWFDTDGSFQRQWNKTHKNYQLFTSLKLSDRQPVELFSNVFETSLRYEEANTITPNGVRYVAKTFLAVLSGPKAIWFTENISPYLIKKAKREYAGNVLQDTVRSKAIDTWTKDEVTHYLATVIEGDGSIQIITKNTARSLKITVSSNDTQYLANLVYIAASKLNVNCKFKKHTTYQTKRGVVTMFVLYINCSRRNFENLGFIKLLIKYNVMTLDRKKERAQEYVTWFENKTKNLKLESRV